MSNRTNTVVVETLVAMLFWVIVVVSVNDFFPTVVVDVIGSAVICRRWSDLCLLQASDSTYCFGSGGKSRGAKNGLLSCRDLVDVSKVCRNTPCVYLPLR